MKPVKFNKTILKLEQNNIKLQAADSFSPLPPYSAEWDSPFSASLNYTFKYRVS